jgi:hypothetical protein
MRFLCSNSTLRRAPCSMGGGPMIGSQPTPPQSSRLRLAQSCTHGQDPGQGQALLIRPPLGTYSYIVVIMQIFAIL